MTQNEYREIASAILKNDWDENSIIQVGKFSISPFQGTAFDSNYTCYKVQWYEWASVDNVLLAKRIPRSLVVKITESAEETILKLLLQKGFPVPRIDAVLHFKNGSVMIFMEKIPGQELYSCSEDAAWINAITALSKIHREFWMLKSNIPTNIPFSNTVSPKIHQAYSNTAHNKYWKSYMDIVSKRLETAPRTLIHGDMFPTNILMHQGDCKFVDWANAGISPYMMDVGRLTAIIDKNTFLPMCPCSEKVILAYFEKIGALLQMEYDDYLKDILMAQFIELAYFYSPPGFYGHKEKYNQTLEQRLHEIVAFHFK